MNDVHAFEILVLAFLSMLIAVFCTRKSLELLTQNRNASRWLSLLVLFMAYFHFLLDFGHPCCEPFQLPYDLPAVAFFAAGIWLMLAQRYAWYYLLFVFATLNRETTCFLTLIFLLYESVRRESLPVRRRNLWLGLHVLAQFAVWVAIKLVLTRMYGHNPTLIGGAEVGQRGFEFQRWTTSATS